MNRDKKIRELQTKKRISEKKLGNKRNYDVSVNGYMREAFKFLQIEKEIEILELPEVPSAVKNTEELLTRLILDVFLVAPVDIMQVRHPKTIKEVECKIRYFNG